MSKMQQVLAKFDTRELARHGDPARYRRRAAEFLALYDRLRAGEAFTEDFARQWLDALSRIDGNLLRPQKEPAADAMIAAMKAELPCYAQVTAQLAKDMDRLYNREERNSYNLSCLQGAARLAMAHLRMEKGWLARVSDPAWAEAKRMFNFSREKLGELWDAAHPQPQVIVKEQHHHHTDTVYQQVPMMAPGPNGKYGGF